MDTEQLKDSSAFITHRELVRTQKELRDELTRELREVDVKVDNLRDVVLPLAEAMKQTANNTERMADSMDEFTRAQRSTNGHIYEKINGQDVIIERLTVSSGAQTEQKKVNATIIVAIIGGITTLIASLFALAPLVFG